MIARLNKIPFLLWFTKSVNIKKIDDEKVKIDDELTYINKVNPIKIFLLKYLGLIFFAIYLFDIYNFNFISVMFGSLLLLITISVLKLIKSYFLVYSILFSILSLTGIFLYDLEIEIEQILYIAIYFSFIGFLAYDIRRLFQNKDIYYFTSLTKNITVNSKRKIPQIVPKFIKKFREKKINLLDLDTAGFYIKIKKDTQC